MVVVWRKRSDKGFADRFHRWFIAGRLAGAIGFFPASLLGALPLAVDAAQPPADAPRGTTAVTPSPVTGSTLPGSCPRPKSAVASTKPRTYNFTPPRPVRRDRSCLVSAGKVVPPASPYTLVDVRPADAYERYRIPGSINVPLHAVKAKPFLRAAQVVLINEGRSSAGLESTCAELREAGFTRVAILAGGLNAWRDTGGRLEGDYFAQKSLNRMSAEELFVERHYDDWLIVDISPKPRADTRKALPQVVAFGRPLDEARFTAALKAAVSSKRKAVGEAKVLIAGENGTDYDRAERLIRRAGIANVFYLEGGFAAYRDFQAHQIAMWRKADQPPKGPACNG